MNAFLFYLLQFTWGIIQNLAGFIAFLILAPTHKHERFNHAVITYVNAKGIVDTAKEVMAESHEPSKMREVEELSVDIISSLCNQGDALALEVMHRTGYILGVGLANYASMVNPEAIIFTGDVIHAGNCLLDPTIEAFNSHVFHNVEGKVKFLISQFDESEANLLGASVLAWNVKEYSLFK